MHSTSVTEDLDVVSVIHKVYCQHAPVDKLLCNGDGGSFRDAALLVACLMKV
ncbi:MAG: hypothetical protein Q8K59_11180 [Nitrosomonas sp.]|nr:hypothetical protein [Nitrosomonas sp.]MDP1951632.1 hypothetical protein [Nitrosomonas sp.]